MQENNNPNKFKNQVGWWDLSIPRVLWGAWIGSRVGRKGNWHRTHASLAEDFDLYALVASDRIIHGEEFLGISIHFSARSNFSWHIMIQLQEIFYVGHQEDCDEMRKEIYKLNYCNITPLLTLDSLKVSEDTRNMENFLCLMLGDCSSSALKVVYWKAALFCKKTQFNNCSDEKLPNESIVLYRLHSVVLPECPFPQKTEMTF